MSDTKTSGLSALGATPATGDLFMVVDVSDTTMAATGTNKYLVASYVVSLDRAETLTNKTLTTPVIGDFTNAGHSHTNSAGGGQLDHGAALTGLTDDDHTQYLLADGTRTGASAGTQTFTNIVRANGGLGINTDPTLADIRSSKTSTATSSLDTSIFTTLTASPASAPAAGTSYRGLLFQVMTAAAATDLSNVTLYGALGQVTHAGTGTLDAAYGLNPGVFLTGIATVNTTACVLTNVSFTAAGTITNHFGMRVATVNNSGGATVTNNHGFRVEAQTVGTNIYGFYGNIAAASSRYNIYMVGTAQNYLAGQTGFGVTVPTAMVHAAASTTARASVCKPHGSAPTSPVNGDEWTTTAGSFVQINGTTKAHVLVSSPATYTPSNVTTDRTYDANATTLDEVADVLGTLIADLKLTGIIL